MNTLTTARGAGADFLRNHSPQQEVTDSAPAPDLYDPAQFEDEREIRWFTNITDTADEMGGV